MGQGDTFKYTGTAQHDFQVDLQKFGGPQHGRLICTLEHIWGEFGNVTFNNGGVATVFNAFMPVDFEAQGVPRITNFFYLQPLSEKLILGVGKCRLPGTADNDIFAGGDGTDQFVNQNMVASPGFIALMPISTFVATAVMPGSTPSMEATTSGALTSVPSW